jgi:hypothetical protein
LQSYIQEVDYEITKINLILDSISSESGSGSGSGSGSLLSLATINARDVIYTNPKQNYTSNLEAEILTATNGFQLMSGHYNNFTQQIFNINKQLKSLQSRGSGSE